MLAPVLNRRFLAIALVLLLLVTQHLGLQHMLGHALQSDAATAVHALAAHAADQAAGGDPTDAADEAADGLCKLCLLLATLGVATLPALLQWRAQLRSQAVRVLTRVRQWAAPALPGYQARAPPRFLPN